MTTILDPQGAPVPVYNRSGTAIATVQGAVPQFDPSTGSPIGVGSQIPSITGSMVAMLQVMSQPSGPAGFAFVLPSGAEIGDVVEAYFDRNSTSTNGTAAMVFPPVGESISTLPVSTGTNPSVGVLVGQGGSGLRFRKVSSSNWCFAGKEA